MNSSEIVVVDSVDEYLQHSYKSGEGNNFLLIGENSADKNLQEFSGMKKVFLYGGNVQKCSGLNNDNIKKIAFTPENMDSVLL